MKLQNINNNPGEIKELGSLWLKDFTSEMEFTASRSSGPGGQNVNKVNSKIELRFDINKSQLLTEKEKETLFEKLATKISQDGILIIVSQSKRTQLANKENAIAKYYSIVQKALTPKKKRKRTIISPEAKEKRLEEKRLKSNKKALRQKP